MAESPEMVRILDVKIETPMHKTFVLDKKSSAKPGQFCMIWLPRIDEKPMSFSNVKGNIAVTVAKVGRFTEELFRKKKGDFIGFRGPYGNSFKAVKGRVMVVGGGCGVAPLMPLVRELSAKKSKVHLYLGSKTRSECLLSKGTPLRKEMEKLCCEVKTTTDDSEREDYFVTSLVEEALGKEKFAMVYSCGPEVMMKKVMDLCEKHKTYCQLSLERYMKCGIGICGSCMLSGYRVCVDGPVFNGRQLKNTEFGECSRTAEGRKTRHH